jgi:hypothetical protein
MIDRQTEYLADPRTGHERGVLGDEQYVEFVQAGWARPL